MVSAASVALLRRCNIGQLKHLIETVLSSWQKPENGSADYIRQSEDYISQLPDEILGNILSLLTIKEAVRTSILSKRWRHLSEYLTAVNLDWFVMSGATDRTYLIRDVSDACGRHRDVLRGHESDVCARYFGSFRDNTNRFLRTCKNQKLLSFELSACMIEGSEYVLDVARWIKFGLDKDVEKLTLKFFCGDYCDKKEHKRCYVRLRTSYFSGLSKLKHLRLHSSFLSFDSKSMFTSLVTLNLSYIVLDGESLECILSTSSSLEEVRLEVCVLPSELHFGDSLQHLKTLAIVYCKDLTQVEIWARNLKTLEFLGLGLVQFVISEACKIETFVWKTDQGDLDKIFGGHLPTHLPHLKKLSLMVPSFAVHQMPADPWTFYSVKTLDLFVFYHDGRSDLVKFLPPLLKSLPNLQKLRVIMRWDIADWADIEEPYELWEHKHLKEVEIGSFFRAGQMRFAIYLLRCATELEQMVIDQSLWDYIGYGIWTPTRPWIARLMFAIARYLTLPLLEKEAVSKNAKIIFR